MPISTYALQVAENNITVMPPKIIVLAAATATLIFPDQTKQNNPGVSDDVVQRLVQNCSTAENLYLSFGIGTKDAPECNAVDQFHCILGPLQQRDVSNDRRIVCGYSVAGGNVSTEVRWRTTNLAGLQSIAN